MRIRKAVILAAGLGTRLVPFSKEMPKEMLPLYTIHEGMLVLKPILQMIFEQLYAAGIREFCFVVGRGKRHVEDHFTPDWGFVEALERKGRERLAKMLRSFYDKVESSLLVWVNQPEPMGTGDAILRSRYFIEDSVFFAVAGDNLYLGRNVFRDLAAAFSRYAGSFLTVRRVEEPSRYGVIEYEALEDPVLRVLRIFEKPEKPPSDLANTSLYIMFPEIFPLIERSRPSPRGEIEVTDAIQMYIDEGYDVYAYRVDNAYWMDVGTPETYLEATLLSLKALGMKADLPGLAP